MTTSTTEASLAVRDFGNYSLSAINSTRYILPTYQNHTVPQLRLSIQLAGYGRYFYATNSSESDALVAGNSGWVLEQIMGYCFTTPVPDPLPFYRLHNDQLFNHFYSTSATEVATAESDHAYVFEGVICHPPVVASTSTLPVLRLYAMCSAGEDAHAPHLPHGWASRSLWAQTAIRHKTAPRHCSAAPPNTEQHSSHTGAIVGAIVGGLAASIIFGALGFLIGRRKRQVRVPPYTQALLTDGSVKEKDTKPSLNTDSPVELESRAIPTERPVALPDSSGSVAQT
ncbi:uncharacterized protein A1O5_03250 [Cladophialophora psammophila CBS 110553]|uniref:DUF5648 domain-containing protein n=1 Tax=Cladophialophora psammophila CBS 110553 TaxID=1182543 RepID=W9XT78_9EURO|nr:uncharacterized protein A1O5_03250 [Cladophialophora psammophila CBS 110553]EXJ73489.1 hypothetical protein A1O5_03250 [Cladophialophora psammophila CBS 110553]